MNKMTRRDFLLASAGMAGATVPGVLWGAEPCPPPQVSISGGTSVATNCTITTGRTYSTSFNLVENPISEGGAWSHAATAWKTIRTTGGRAHAVAYTDSFDDAYAILSGFPPNVQAEATIYKNGPGYETELLLRMAHTANSVRGYECLFNVNGQGVAIVRWNGPRGNFTFVPGNLYNSPVAVTGDKIRARIVGSTIQLWHIPVSTGVPALIADAVDSTFTDGQPGIAFYAHAPVVLTDFGFSDYSVVSI